jgi:putative proteasome-type protease
MTFCVAMKVQDGLVGIADTRVTTGTEHITARKVSIHQHGRHSMFLMTSGLRSVRDKAVTYYDEVLEESDQTFDKLYKAVGAFAAQVRRVAREDKETLEKSGFTFNLHSIVGGQLENDKEHKLYLLYPQGNWVEVVRSTPYHAIGESSYGKPLLDRTLRFDTSMDLALKIGYLAFDATRTSATDVGFPIDVVLYRRDTFTIVEHRFEEKDLAPVAEWWQQRIGEAVSQCPAQWSSAALAKVPAARGGGP